MPAHDLLGLGLAVTGEGLDEGGNLHAADDRVFLHVENLLERELAALEIVANLSALDAGGLGLLESCLTLFGAELRNCHRESLLLFLGTTPTADCR